MSNQVTSKEAEKTENTATVIPAVDIVEREKEYVLYADAPGIDKDKISITYEDGVLSLVGNIKIKSPQSYSHQEFAPMGVERTFRLSDDIDTDKISAHVDHGVLSVVLPKKEKLKKVVPLK